MTIGNRAATFSSLLPTLSKIPRWSYHCSPASPPPCLIADGPSVEEQAASTEQPSGMHLQKPFVNLQAAIRVMNVCRGFSAIPHKSENSSSIAHHLVLDWQSPTPQLEVLHIGWMASIAKWTLCSEGEKTATSALRSLEGNKRNGCLHLQGRPAIEPPALSLWTYACPWPKVPGWTQRQSYPNQQVMSGRIPSRLLWGVGLVACCSAQGMQLSKVQYHSAASTHMQIRHIVSVSLEWLNPRPAILGKSQQHGP